MTPPNESPAALLRKALSRAFALGQDYWALADSDSYAANRKSIGVRAKFGVLVEETVAALASPAPAASDSRGSGVVDGWRKHELLDIARCLRFPQGYGSTRTELRACMISFGEQIQRIVKGLPDPDAAPAPPAVASGEPTVAHWRQAIVDCFESDEDCATYDEVCDIIERRARALAEGKK